MAIMLLPARDRTYKKQKTRHGAPKDVSGDVQMLDAGSRSASSDVSSTATRVLRVKLSLEDQEDQDERRAAVRAALDGSDPEFLTSFHAMNMHEVYKQRRREMGENSAEVLSPLQYRKYRLELPDLTPKRTPAVDKFRTKLNKLGGPPVTFVNEVDDEDPPLHFELVRDLVFDQEVLALNPDFMVSCECEVCDGECCCRNEVLQYDDNGRMIQSLNSGRKHVDSMTECSTFCLCFPDCKNTVVTKGRQIPLEVFKTTNRGWGLRCPIDLKAGTFIDCYFGDLIKRNPEQEGNYLFDLDFFDEYEEEAPRLTIDGEHRGSLTRFMNNSCQPNCRCVPVCPSELSSQMGWYYLALFTNKDIPAFTELTFRYAGHASKLEQRDPEEIAEGNRCYCGAPTCCGYMWY